MKKNKLWMLAAILFCGLGMLFASCSSSDDNVIVDGGEDVTPDEDTPADGGGGVTPATNQVVVMYYAVGGGDIDHDIEDGLGNMGLQQLKGNGVRSFVQLKYSSKRFNEWEKTYEPSGEYGSVYRFEMNKSSLNPNFKGDIYEAKVFAGEGFKKFAGKDFKMYDPANLAAYINWCMEQAPGAKAYVLAFGNHGGGYDIAADGSKNLTRGVMYDDNLTDKPCMSATEIAAALDKVSRKPDMIFFDCCLMSSLEVLGELQGRTNFVFASGHAVLQTPLFLLCVALENVAKAADVTEGIKKFMTECVINITQDMEEKMKADKGGRIKRSMDYTLTDMSKLPALFASIKAVSDFLAKTDISGMDVDLFNDAASGCYRYADDSPFFDIVSYLNQLKEKTFKGNAEFAGLVSQVEAAAKACHVAHDEFSYDSKGTDKKYGLTYSVILGFSSSRLIFDNPKVKPYAPKEPMGVVMQVTGAGSGTEEDPYYNSYLFENGDCFLADWQKGAQEMTFRDLTSYYAKGSGAYQSWDNTYRTLLFDKATGWSNWMKKNPGIGYDNPPYDDQYNYVFEKPSWSELTGE